MSWWRSALRLIGGGSHSGLHYHLKPLRERFLDRDEGLAFGGVLMPSVIKLGEGPRQGDAFEAREAERQARRPVAYWLLSTAPRWIDWRLLSPIYHGVWWVMHRVHPEHRHHVVVTRLEPGWHDVDELMLHAMMRLLERYVDDEMGGLAEVKERARWLREEAHDPNAPDGWNDHSGEVSSLDEIVGIYLWWQEHRERREAIDELGGDYFAEDQKAREIEDEMMRKLVGLRHGMWR